jgi:transposase
MPNTRLTPAKWKRILEFLRSDSSVYVKDEAECRKFIEAVVWINRTGAPWRDLPEKFGKSNSVFRRFTLPTSIVGEQLEAMRDCAHAFSDACSLSPHSSISSAC